jgi:hypothetical protein
MNALFNIQQELKAPKNQRNNFGNYSYRSAEDILEAVKPLLNKYKCTLQLSDSPISVGDWVFLTATAVLTDEDGNTWSSEAVAKHSAGQKGMQDQQVSGSTSSYARKYALNGLFAIDDNKDADTDENTIVTRGVRARKGSGTQMKMADDSVTPAQLKFLKGITRNKSGILDQIKLEFEVERLEDLSKAVATDVIAKYK